jgi:hypothetical protein
MSAVTFTHTGSLKSSGWSDFVPESAPDSNGIYYWDVSRSGTNLNSATGSGWLSYDPSTQLFTYAEGTLSSVTINGVEYWSYTDSVSLRVQFLKTAPFNGPAPSSGGGGGGTSTEGVAVESGSLTLVNGDIVYVVDSTSITHTYYLKIDGLFAGGSHSNWQHTAGTESGGTFPNAQDGKYTLEYEESASPFNHIKIAELIVKKKVFSNFW